MANYIDIGKHKVAKNGFGGFSAKGGEWMAKRFIDAENLNYLMCSIYWGKDEEGNEVYRHTEVAFRADIEEIPTADVVEVADVSEQIIRKKAEVSEYWKNDVKQYRALKGYSDIEHDVDNFLRGYNEAVEDMLAILDERRKDDE